MNWINCKLTLATTAFMIAAVSCATGATVESSWGWDTTYPAVNTVDGVFGTANFGKIASNGWVVYDFGKPVLISKIRICAPTFSGSGAQSVNPTNSIFGFSNDKSAWNSITTCISPRLESVNCTDMTEVALPQAVCCRYVKWIISSEGQIGEIFFITIPQFAVQEQAQNVTNTNSGAAWKTVDGNPATYGGGINTEGYITYDQGSSKPVYGFTMQGRIDAGSANPTSGELWVSNSPATNYQQVGSWTLPSLSAGQTGTVDLGISNAKSGRYLQLRNLSGGDQWAEFKTLSHFVYQGQAATAIIIPDTTFTVVHYAATELQYHIQKATGVTLGIFSESDKPSGYQGLIYLGNCAATQNAGITTASLGANGFTSRRYGNDIFILGDDTEGEVLSMNRVRVGTLFGVYNLLESKMGVRWLWPGESGEVIPHMVSIITPDIDTTHTPQLVHSRIRDGQWATNYGWSTEQARDKYQLDQETWQRRHRFARGISLEYPHSFEDWWSRFGTSHPDYFNRLPDGTRKSDPTYCGGGQAYVSVDVSAPGMWSQKIQDWQNTRTADLPWISCAENDTNGKCTCSTCMSWDVRDPKMTDDQWNNRLTYAANEFNAGTTGWETKLGSLSDRYARFYLSVQQQAQSIDPNATVVAYAYENYQRSPLQTQLNDHIVIGYVPGFMFPWSETKSQEFKDSWNGWYNTGAKLYFRPNYFLDGHNLPIFFADKFGDDFTYAFQRGMFSTDFDSLTGQWAAQPLNLYMLGRKNAHGDIPTNDVFAEFYSAFGPAETAIRNYFAFLKSVSDAVTDVQKQEAGADCSNFYETGSAFFTPTILATARSYMTLAQQAASGNAAAEQKVVFLEKGLHHAELQTAAARAWKDYTSAVGGFSAWNNAINALDSFRVSVEMDDVANMNYLRYLEDRTWQRTRTTMPVTSGSISPLHGDSLQIDSNSFYAKNLYGSEVYILLDAGIAKTVDKILLKNPVIDTFYTPNSVTIYVSSDELASDFDPYTKSSYTTQVFSGSFSPSAITAGTVRSADISNQHKRYFLLKMTSNFWGNTSDSSNSNAQMFYFSDINTQIVSDSAPPTGSIIINSSDAYSTSESVTLSLSASDEISGVSSMRFSNDNSNWTDWEPYMANKTWNLTTGDGTKTVYVQCKDGSNNISASFNDAIMLDTMPPTGSIVINSGSGYTYSADAILTLSASDTTSGIAQMKFSNDGSTWSGWEIFSTAKPWELSSGTGEKTVRVAFRDSAGLSSVIYSDRITVNATASGKLELTGRLVTVWGRITFRAPDASYFYIDDGSNLDDGSGRRGLRIVCSSSFNQIPSSAVPQEQDYVRVVGVAIRFKDPLVNNWINAVAVRDSNDITH